MDRLSTEDRSALMQKIGSGDTAPELIVRKMLHKMGLRFRLHVRDLAGTPDIVLPKYKTAVFVHGCFWHQHSGCKRCFVPKSNCKFWRKKLERNVQRDSETEKSLKDAGWRVLVVWECETQLRRQQELQTKLNSYFLGRHPHREIANEPQRLEDAK